ncbi:hypothetical protein ACJ5M9_005107 [Vibrio campbellii]
MSSNEDEMQRRLSILQENFKAGKVRVCPEAYEKVGKSLELVRMDSNGKVDLNTVDASVRAMANAITTFHDREENKKLLPLSEIQKAYFGFIETNFSFFYEMMIKANKDPDLTARFFSQDHEKRAGLLKSIPEFLNHIRELWLSCGDVAWDHLEDMNTLKLSHAGDLFPSYSHNIASKCGIYSDTIVLPCPFVRTLELYPMWDDQQKVYYLLKHALGVLAYKDLALAEFTAPIVAILPEPKFFEENEAEFVQSLAEADSLKLAGQAFERKFESIEEAYEYFSSLDSASKVLKEVRDDTKLLADIELGNDPEKQLKQLCDVPFGAMAQFNVGQKVFTNFLGRMGQANDALLKSRRLRGVPVIDAPTSWRYFNWKLQLDSSQLDYANKELLHCSHALTSLDGTELSWLGSIPTQSLIEIREQGALEELREMVGSNLESLIKASPDNFGQTTYQVYKNFQNAFDEHNKKLAELRSKKWRFGGIEIGSMLCTGAIELTAVATGTPLFGFLNWGVGQLVDAPKIKDIPQKYKELAEADKKLSNSPVGLLVQCKK